MLLSGQTGQRVLEEAAAAWERDDRDTAGLYRGTRLAVAHSWASTSTRKPTSAPPRPHSSMHRYTKNAAPPTAAELCWALLCALALLASGTAVVAVQKNATAQRASAIAQRASDTAIFNQLTAEADRARH